MGEATNKLMGRRFDPAGEGYDMDTARAFGMKPEEGDGPNRGHFGSVVPTTPQQQQVLGLPKDSYMLLKGLRHPTFDKAVAAEKRRGFDVKKFGDRFFSVPKLGKTMNE